MKTTNFYRASFLTKKGEHHYWRCDIEAHNLKEARDILDTLWYETYNDSRHMFSIQIRRLKDDEEFIYSCPKTEREFVTDQWSEASLETYKTC